MNSKALTLCILFILLPYEKSLAQEKPDLTRYQKRLIDKIEFVAGLGLFLPNDHGYSEFILNTSQGTETFETQKKVGYSIGLGLISSRGRHFEIRGRILFEGKGYVQTDISTNIDVKKYVYDFSNNYVTYSILPTILLGRNNRLNVFAGIFYSQLTKSTFIATEYLNGQIQSSHQLTGNVASYESGILGGLGCAIYKGNRISIDIQAQGNYGLSDIVNQNMLRITSASLMFYLNVKYTQGMISHSM